LPAGRVTLTFVTFVIKKAHDAVPAGNQ